MNTPKDLHNFMPARANTNSPKDLIATLGVEGEVERGHLNAAKVRIPRRPLFDAMPGTMSRLIHQLAASLIRSRTPARQVAGEASEQEIQRGSRLVIDA